MNEKQGEIAGNKSSGLFQRRSHRQRHIQRKLGTVRAICHAAGHLSSHWPSVTPLDSLSHSWQYVTPRARGRSKDFIREESKQTPPSEEAVDWLVKSRDLTAVTADWLFSGMLTMMYQIRRFISYFWTFPLNS